jgi:ADP-L-glycero-D-manno-heptose 6-epimerase
MIVVTGAAGFIGSYVARYLNEQGISDLVLVDYFKNETSENWKNLQVVERMDPSSLLAWISENNEKIEYIIHMGAITDTMATDVDLVYSHNTEYTKALWIFCTHFKIPFIYASSAATYGDGAMGYEDDQERIDELQPLNLYAHSKQDFDLFALSNLTPPNWHGLKFFNVYGPGESHKGRMASVIYHAKNQILLGKKVSLFKSYNEKFKDGEQLRDFVYVKDIAKVIYWILKKLPESGIYNLGTGKARSFLDLARSVFAAMDLEENIEFIEMPEELRDKYQYFTEAKMEKLRNAGYEEEFTSLEDGVRDYLNTIL